MNYQEYQKDLTKAFNEHYNTGKCPYFEDCFAGIEEPLKLKFDYATKVGRRYGEEGCPKILIVGQEGKADHEGITCTAESLDPEKGGANNEHYRKTLYSLALILKKEVPKSFAVEDLKCYEDLLQRFCLTNYYKCAIATKSTDCHGLKHTNAMKENCYRLLVKEIDKLKPDFVVIQGKFTPEAFWTAYGPGERINGNKTKETDTLSLYKYQHKGGGDFYILYSYHPCYFCAWSGELLQQFQELINNFLEKRAEA